MVLVMDHNEESKALHHFIGYEGRLKVPLILLDREFLVGSRSFSFISWLNAKFYFNYLEACSKSEKAIGSSPQYNGIWKPISFS